MGERSNLEMNGSRRDVLVGWLWCGLADSLDWRMAEQQSWDWPV